MSHRQLSSSGHTADASAAADDGSRPPPPGISVPFGAEEGYHSQDGQDIWANEHVFHNRTGGFFVDLGCYDGVTYSNTHFFEMRRGWRGVCAEPNPGVFPRIRETGRRSGVALAVSGTGGRSVSLVSAFMRSSLNASAVDYDFMRRHGIQTHTVEVPVVTPRELLGRHLPAGSAGATIDYVSIDVEGEELSVLSTWPFDSYCVQLFNIEARHNNNSPPSNRRPHDAG